MALPNLIKVNNCGDVKKIPSEEIYASQKVRISFEPMIVGPEHGMGLKGDLYIERRKSEKDSWPTIVDFTRGYIEPGKYTRFEFRSGELKALYDFIGSILQFGGKNNENIEGTYYRINCEKRELIDFIEKNQLFRIAHPNEYELITSILKGNSDYINAVVNQVNKIANNEEKLQLLSQVVDKLLECEPTIVDVVLKSLDRNKEKILQNRVTIKALNDLRNSIEELDDTGKEEDWQKLFEDNKWVLPYVLPGSHIYLYSKANVGNIKMDVDSSEVDFVLQNECSSNIALVEIKTPQTPLICSSEYRNGVYAIDKELSGAISQILSYRHWFVTSHPELKKKKEYTTFNPKCVLIIGSLSKLDENKIQSFELFRQSLANVIVLTYDEVVERIRDLIDLSGA